MGITVGMRDVAREAGVSLSTVSLVVNGTGYVSDEMRDKVRAAMERLDYVPNELARNLSRNRTDLIGLIVPTIRHPFFSALTAGVQRALHDKGFRTILCSTADEDQDVGRYVDMLRRHMMDGIIMGAHTDFPSEYWTAIGRPLVAFDRWLGPGIPLVASDYELGANVVAELLAKTGAHHVALVGGPREQFHDRYRSTVSGGMAKPVGPLSTFPSSAYYLTLERELDQAGIEHDYIQAGPVEDLESYGRATHWVCEPGRGFDALISSDLGAAYAVQEGMRQGIRIPQEMQVIAYDGTYLTNVAGMRITAVHQDLETITQRLGLGIAHVVEKESLQQPEFVSGAQLGDGLFSRLVRPNLIIGETTR